MQKLRQLRRLPGTRLSDDDRDLVLSDHRDQLVAAGRDGQEGALLGDGAGGREAGLGLGGLHVGAELVLFVRGPLFLFPSLAAAAVAISFFFFLFFLLLLVAVVVAVFPFLRGPPGGLGLLLLPLGRREPRRSAHLRPSDLPEPRAGLRRLALAADLGDEPRAGAGDDGEVRGGVLDGPAMMEKRVFFVFFGWVIGKDSRERERERGDEKK